MKKKKTKKQSVKMQRLKEKRKIERKKLKRKKILKGILITVLALIVFFVATDITLGLVIARINPEKFASYSTKDGVSVVSVDRREFVTIPENFSVNVDEYGINIEDTEYLLIHGIGFTKSLTDKVYLTTPVSDKEERYFLIEYADDSFNGGMYVDREYVSELYDIENVSYITINKYTENSVSELMKIEKKDVKKFADSFLTLGDNSIGVKDEYAFVEEANPEEIHTFSLYYENDAVLRCQMKISTKVAEQLIDMA